MIQSWNLHGNEKGVHIGLVELDSVQYVAGYCLKKLTDKDRGSTRLPEFHRASTRPGIGHSAVAKLAEAWIKNLAFWKDAPTAVRLGGSIHPLGRYLRQRIRKVVGNETGEAELLEGKTPGQVQEIYKEEVSRMQAGFKTLAKGKGLPPRFIREMFVAELGDVNSALSRSVEAKAEIYQSRRHSNEAF